MQLSGLGERDWVRQLAVGSSQFAVGSVHVQRTEWRRAGGLGQMLSAGANVAWRERARLCQTHRQSAPQGQWAAARLTTVSVRVARGLPVGGGGQWGARDCQAPLVGALTFCARASVRTHWQL